MEDCGLDPDGKPMEKVSGCPSGKFPDLWGDDEPTRARVLSKTASSFRKGDIVRLKASPGVKGTITGIGREVCAVSWDGGSLGLYQFSSLVLD
jgi:hypothetical protein